MFGENLYTQYKELIVFHNVSLFWSKSHPLTWGGGVYDLYFSHQGAIQMIWLHFEGAVMSSIKHSLWFIWRCAADWLPDLDGGVRQDLPVTAPAAVGFAVGGCLDGADGAGVGLL